MTSRKKLSNYDYFIKMDTTPYKGQWIAIANEKVIDHGRKADTVYYRAKKKNPTADISLAKIPFYDVVIYNLDN